MNAAAPRETLTAFQHRISHLRRAAAAAPARTWGLRVSVDGVDWWVPLARIAGILPPGIQQSWPAAPRGSLGVREQDGILWTVWSWSTQREEAWLLLARPGWGPTPSAWTVDMPPTLVPRPATEPIHADQPQRWGRLGWRTESGGWCWWAEPDNAL